MRTTDPTFWPLGGRLGWPQASEAQNMAVNRQTTMRLATTPLGRLSLMAASDSLGELTLPRGMALDENGRLYLLVGSQIKRFQADRQQFVPLPTVGSVGNAARQFSQPANIACAAYSLFVADQGNGRVQQFDLNTLALQRIWTLPDAGVPVDIAAYAGMIFVLDGKRGRVYVQNPNLDRIRLLIDAPGKRWQRVAIDTHGCLYLLNGEAQTLDVYSAKGVYQETAVDAGQVRDQFETPVVRLDHRGHFTLPPSCHMGCLDSNARFNRVGTPIPFVDPAAPLGAPPYQQGGLWISPPLDSQIHQCQWHKIELDAAALPAGSSVEIHTFTADEALDAATIAALPETLWAASLRLTGEMQPPPESSENNQQREPEVALIQSGEGQLCWVRICLFGDGYETPVLKGLRVHYPRHSYAAYLPAVFSEDDEARSFLTRYLSIVEAEWGRIEQHIAEISRYFDPQAVPAGMPLRYLADWFALPLEGAWNDAQKRRLLNQMSTYYPKRGTAVALRSYAQTYLQNMTTMPPHMQGEFPKLVEGFRARQYMNLLSQENGTLDRQMPLWGPAKVGRLQTDVYAEVGNARLVSLGDPQTDIFDSYAHRFRVFMPAAWISTKADEAMIRRAIDTEKPAYTEYELCLIAPRFRIGIQSTVGIDTIVGGYPKAQLLSDKDADRAPSLPKSKRLGFDMIL